MQFIVADATKQTIKKVDEDNYTLMDVLDLLGPEVKYSYPMKEGLTAYWSSAGYHKTLCRGYVKNQEFNNLLIIVEDEKSKKTYQF